MVGCSMTRPQRGVNEPNGFPALAKGFRYWRYYPLPVTLLAVNGLMRNCVRPLSRDYMECFCIVTRWASESGIVAYRPVAVVGRKLAIGMVTG
jgi:hypothetical protein